MLNLFKKTEWYNFYLPNKILTDIKEVNISNLEIYFKEQKVIFNKLELKKISDSLYYISINFNDVSKKNSFITFIENFSELIPPWLAFEDIFDGSPRWNQGYQEDYCIQKWMPYWNSLNKIQKTEYLLKYNCPKTWNEWFSENNLI